MAQERVADEELIFFRGTQNSTSCSIVFRGPNTTMLDEMERFVCFLFLYSQTVCRAMHDALCVVARTLESGSVVAGGGAVETALNIYLENFATTMVRIAPLALCSLTLLVCRVRDNNSPWQSLPTRCW